MLSGSGPRKETIGVDTIGYIEAVRREGTSLLAAADRAGLGTAVPSCPGWALRDLLAHLGYVHRWATRYVAEGIEHRLDRHVESDVLAAAPADEALLDWARDGHAALVRALEDAPPGLRCWSFLPARTPVEFWARRQAHETAIHRVDAQLCAAAPVTAFGAEFAADGVDEVLSGFLGRPGADAATDGATWTLGLAATDHAASWSVRVFDDHVEPCAEGGPCDVVVRGPVSDIYQLVWNRRALPGLELSGNTGHLRNWAEFFQITWPR